MGDHVDHHEHQTSEDGRAKGLNREVSREEPGHQFQLNGGQRPEAQNQEDQTDTERADGEKRNERREDPAAYSEQDAINDAFRPEGSGEVNAADHRKDVGQHERREYDAQSKTYHVESSFELLCLFRAQPLNVELHLTTVTESLPLIGASAPMLN